MLTKLHNNQPNKDIKEAMQVSLEHLPENKQQELDLVVEIIREYSNPEMIILFGSYARGDWVEEKFEDEVHYKYQSDFDIFVVTRTDKEAIRIEGNNHISSNLYRRLKTPVSLIAHDIDFFNRRLKKGQYFFSDIKKEGISLFDSGNFYLAEARELSFAERKNLARKDFEYWFKGAKDFFIDYEAGYNRGSYSKAAFELHQVVERLFSCILLVYTKV